MEKECQRFDDLKNIFGSLLEMGKVKYEKRFAVIMGHNLLIAQKAIRTYADIHQDSSNDIIDKYATVDNDGNPVGVILPSGQQIWDYGKNKSEAEKLQRELDRHLIPVRFIKVKESDLPKNIEPTFIAPLIGCIIDMEQEYKPEEETEE